MSYPIVSIIIPCRNESRYISSFLHSLQDQDYDKNKLEVLIADGQSEDDTVSQIASFKKQKVLDIQVFDNPERTVPYALNKLIHEAKGAYIIRMDVHAEYPKNYISKLIQVISVEDCENVGAVVDTLPANDSLKAKCIAKCSSHKFGVGNSQFRISKDAVENFVEVDTVPFGCFKKELFDRIGLFDTDLTRNQDDEFNARILKYGGRILLITDLRIKYFARDNFKKVRKMFFQYGLFKPLTNKKLKKVSTARQLVPPLFVIYILVGWLPTLVFNEWIFIYATGLLVYFLVNIVFSAKMSSSLKAAGLSVVCFTQIHWSYGLGYMKGLIRFIIFNQKTAKKVKQNS